MKIISLFNNKGGVGKTTLAYHLACSLAELNYKVLMLDLDPQCNLTICSMNEEELHKIWKEEDSFIDGFEESKNKADKEKYEEINSHTRTIHYLLKPTEEGTGELEKLPPPKNIRKNLDLIPGRITLHMYEYKISERWSGVYQGDPLSIRTITKIRTLAIKYSEIYNYDFVIIDTSPSLGALNKVIISTVDGFLIPCLPDMFSLYGIRNIGKALSQWKSELETVYKLLSDEKRQYFPKKFVQFLGYTIYNAKKYKGKTEWDLALMHYNYAKQIPVTIKKCIATEVREHLTDEMISDPIGGTSVMHTHNTFPNASQKYKLPIWDIPKCHNLDLAENERASILGNISRYEDTKQAYKTFTEDLLNRIKTITLIPK
ncbi:MAG: cobyrinic acid a,c-diamide synthase [Candidatus Altiarchaeales archaeon A3]|nr:MAG: cobyrinic acid a,c-diamide synthase [Candidatus Altiarchaeales archaeon A3]